MKYEIHFRKFQKDNRTKKQKEEGAAVSISNQFEINSVPKSQKDFISYMEECGIDQKNFLMFSHPEKFMDLGSADCRNILFGMTGKITDKEIADDIGCEELGKMLETYKPDEITAMKKRELKEAKENLDAIPNQIIGMEKSKVDFDVKGCLAKKNQYLDEIDDMKKALAELDVPSIAELNQELSMLDSEERKLVSDANAERINKLSAMNVLIGTMKDEERSLISQKERKALELEETIARNNRLEEEFSSLKEQFEQLKASEYDAKDGKCPYCGQNLPVHELDKAKTAFEEQKKIQMRNINLEAKHVSDKRKEHEQAIDRLDKDVKQLESTIKRLHETIEGQCRDREPLEHVIDVTQTPEHTAIFQKRADVKHRMAKRDAVMAEAEEIQKNILGRQQEIRKLDDMLAQGKLNERIDKQIENMKQKQRDYRAAEDSAKMILDQLKNVSMEKNKRLTDEVNSHFNIVRFRLFEQQINGEYRDCCIPTIQCEDGTYKTLGTSANTALEIRGKLDIISGLQKFYNQYVPVWLDGAECLDSDNRKQIHMDTQLITLAVSDDDLKVEVV